VAIVDGCTEFDTLPPPWQERKLDTLRTYAMPHQHSTASVSQISCTMPVSIGRMPKGDTIWANFSNGKEGTLWFYTSLGVP